MFRSLIVLALTVGIADVAQAQTDSVIGSGFAGTTYFSFSVNSTSGVSGENATGFLDFSLINGTGSAVVQHLCVSGSSAVLTGPVIEGPFVGKGFVLYVDDRSSLRQADYIQLELLAYVPASCPAFEMLAPLTVTIGDLTVTDAPSLPPPPPAVTFDSVSAAAVEYVLASGAPGAAGVANALASQLATAKRASERGNDQAREGVLKAFVSTVAHLDRFLTQAQIDELVASASKL